MGAFVYFVEEYKTQVSLEDVERLGLSYAFDSKPTACRCERGPSGNAGVVFARDGAATGIGFYPQRQTWEESESGEYWVGYEGGKPRAEDLERPQRLRGQDVKLGDGCEWLVPVARMVAEGDDGQLLVVPVLPHSVRKREGVWTIGEVVDTYRRLWEIANRVFDQYVTADTSMFMEYDEAVEALTANYYVGVDEASILQLFTNTGPELREVLSVLVDLKSFIEWGQKKTSSIEGEETFKVGG